MYAPRPVILRPRVARAARLALAGIAVGSIAILLLLYLVEKLGLLDWAGLAQLLGAPLNQVINPSLGPKVLRLMLAEGLGFAVVVGGSILVFASRRVRAIAGDGTLVVFHRLVRVAWLPILAAAYLLTYANPQHLVIYFKVHADLVAVTVPTLLGVVFFGVAALALAPRPPRRYFTPKLGLIADLAPIILGIGLVLSLDQIVSPDVRPWETYVGNVLIVQLTLAAAEVSFVLAGGEAALADWLDVQEAWENRKVPYVGGTWRAFAGHHFEVSGWLERLRWQVRQRANRARVYAPLAPAALRLAVRLAAFTVPVLTGVWLAIGYQLPFASTILDRQGQVLRFYHQNSPLRLYAGQDDVSPWMYKAIDATEDPGLYTSPATHAPVNPIRIVGIFAAAASAASGGGEGLSGGSGITTQSCKNSVGRSLADDVLSLPGWVPGRGLAAAAVTIAQKVIFEFPCGWALERTTLVTGWHRSPVTFYLNQIYFGQGVYGIQAAAMTYFNKPAADLSPAEAALLAGLPQAPSYYDPWRNPQAVRARRSIVLNSMVREGYLSQEQAQAIDASPLGVVARPVVPASRDSEFVDHAVMDWLDAHGYQHMSTDGLIVTTTLDSARQAEAVADLARIVPSLADRGVNDGAALAADPRTGAILVWVAGSPLDGQPLTQLDLVDQWPHQPGSAIKPLLYSCALDEGYLQPNEKLDDTQRVIGGKYVANWDLHGHGILPATEALAQSSNVAAAELADRLTPQGFADCLHSVFGVQANLQASQIGVFLGLGLAEIPMPELVAAFTPLANAGLYHPLVPVARLQEPDGREIYHLEPGGDPVVSCKTVNWLAEPLGEVSQIIGLPPTLATKTGTTPASSFAIGYGRDVIFAAWVGNVTNGSISLALDDVFGKEGGGQVWKAWAQRFELGSQHSVVGCK